MAIKRKKMVDKWKTKKWYEIVAPKMFNSKVIGEAVGPDENSMMNRIVITSLAELGTSGEEGGRRMFSNMKIRLRINEVKGKSAYTKYIGHEIMPGYLRTLARKQRSVIDVVADKKTKDGEIIRLKLVAITGSPVSQNTKKNIRKALEETLESAVPEMTFEDLVLGSLQGKLTGKIYNRLKQITRMAKVEVKKLERKETFA